MSEVKPGRYQHFKGKFYYVIDVARNSENPEEEWVVYQALYDHDDFGKSTLWIRPKSMFLEKIVRNGIEVERFKFVEG